MHTCGLLCILKTGSDEGFLLLELNASYCSTVNCFGICHTVLNFTSRLVIRYEKMFRTASMI